MPELTFTDRLMSRLNDLASSGSALQLPPPVFVDMEGQFIDYQEGRTLTARFPNRTRFQNPLGSMQGGIIAALVDNTIGPLSYLTAPPSVTLQLSVSYIRPVTAEDAYVDVTGHVVECTRSQLLLTAEVRNPAGKLAATAHATCRILSSETG